jgi:hypothetical protein
VVVVISKDNYTTKSIPSIMSKKYIAEYVPVEQPPKRGDEYLSPEGKRGIRTTTDTNDDMFYEECRKLKLSFCSSDIQVGDTFNSANGRNFVCTKIDPFKVYSIGGLLSDTEEVAHNRAWTYKVIGEVSPDATWVKEGMEFDESQTKLTITYNGQRLDHIPGHTNYDPGSEMVLIQCPSSPKHFH